MQLTCARCSSWFDPSKGRAGIHVSQGTNQLEQLRNGYVAHVCGRCTDELADWLNLGRARETTREPSRRRSAPLPTS